MTYDNLTPEAGDPDLQAIEPSPQNNLQFILESVNVAEKLDQDELDEIAAECRHGFDNDKESRREWEEGIDEWTKLAMQVREEKTFPWPGASNVKYPLLSTAAMQFAARAYPSLVPSDGKVVKAKVIGKDPKGEKLEKADRVSTYMSYQIMYEMQGWDEQMDKMLIMLPVCGVMFKKTYWDALNEVNCSDIVLPKNLVVNYWTKSLETSERISEVILMSPNKVKERQNAGLFLDVDLGSPTQSLADKEIELQHRPENDELTPHTLIEQHTYLDLDDDGYKEPYVVTFDYDSGKILRIAPRYELADIKTNAKGKIVKINPTQYYTKFGFIPNPDGSFYDIGFGVLLGPINEAVNTLLNQQVDAGTLNNIQGGFIGKGLRMKMGDSAFNPGEWKAVNATADDLRKQIVPLPTKEPSNVLFQLMGSLISSGKELASVAEIFTGKMPGQNTPATTTMATVEQGMKVFTAVYKRLYRGLEQEFKKLFKLNATYLNPQTYAEVLDTAVGPEDFTLEGYDICPGADPSAVSSTERLLKAQGLMELMGTGLLNPVEVVSRVLQAQEQPNWEKLLNPQVAETGQPPAPAPDPKMQEMQMKSQLEQQKVAMQAEQQQHKMELETRSKEAQLAMKAQEHQLDMQHKAKLAQIDAATKLHTQRIFSAQAQADMIQKELAHSQTLRHKEQAASSKKENTSSSQNKVSKTGKTTK